jgi:hypothetical protein
MILQVPTSKMAHGSNIKTGLGRPTMLLLLMVVVLCFSWAAQAVTQAQGKMLLKNHCSS